MKQYKLSRKNLPVSLGGAIRTIWLFLLTKEVWNVPLWLEVPFWIFLALWFIGFFSILSNSIEVDIFEKWNKR